MKAAQIAKANKSLDMVFRYSEGIMSRRQWLKLMQVKGATMQPTETNKYDFNRIKYNRMNAAEQEAYDKKMLEKHIVYRLTIPGQNSFYDLTKTEYDYFQQIQLAEDIATEKHNLSECIEAGIATEEEIQQDMDKEKEFFTKYFGDGN